MLQAWGVNMTGDQQADAELESAAALLADAAHNHEDLYNNLLSPDLVDQLQLTPRADGDPWLSLLPQLVGSPSLTLTLHCSSPPGSEAREQLGAAQPLSYGL